jgi:hypothetical protein
VACPTVVVPPAAGDGTPPVADLVLVRVIEPGSGRVREEFDVLKLDFTHFGYTPGNDIRVTVLTGDPESGIANVTLESGITWRCSLGRGSQTIGVTESEPLAFAAFSQPAQPLSHFQIDTTATPRTRVVCAQTGRPGAGPIDVRGFVRAVVTNGAGGVLRSRTFLFEDTPSRDTAYMAQCRRRGVPIPPDWSLSTTQWLYHGALRGASNLLDGADDPAATAEVWTWSDPLHRGACVILPRSAGGVRGGLSGIICQNATSGFACFWDSRKRDDANPTVETPALDWRRQTLRVNELMDASNLPDDNGGGVCTDCHRGENVFLMAPDAAPWRSVLEDAPISRIGANFTTRVESSADTRGGKPRYVPFAMGRPRWERNDPLPGCGGGCHDSVSSSFTPASGFVMPPTCADDPLDPSSCYR